MRWKARRSPQRNGQPDSRRGGGWRSDLRRRAIPRSMFEMAIAHQGIPPRLPRRSCLCLGPGVSCLMCSHRATLPSRIHIRPPTLPRSHGRRGTYTHRRCRTLLTACHCSGYRVAWSQVLLFRIRPTSSAPLPFVSSLPPAFPAPARRRTSCCCCCCCCHGCEVAWVKVVPVCPSFAIFSGPDLSRPAGDGRGWTKTKRRLFQVVIKRLAHPSPCSPATCPATLPVSCCEVVSNSLQARRVALATAPTCSTRRTRTTPGPATACHRAHRAAACHRFDSPSPVTRRHHHHHHRPALTYALRRPRRPAAPCRRLLQSRHTKCGVSASLRCAELRSNPKLPPAEKQART